MKSLSPESSRGRKACAEKRKYGAAGTVLGSIPGLERLLPGRYVPGDTVRSRYGTWTLPRSFRGQRITAIIDGTLLG
jgi:hypothetical protein